MRMIKRAWDRVVRIITMMDYVMGITPLETMHQAQPRAIQPETEDYQGEGVRET